MGSPTEEETKLLAKAKTYYTLVVKKDFAAAWAMYEEPFRRQQLREEWVQNKQQLTAGRTYAVRNIRVVSNDGRVAVIRSELIVTGSDTDKFEETTTWEYRVRDRWRPAGWYLIAGESD